MLEPSTVTTTWQEDLTCPVLTEPILDPATKPKDNLAQKLVAEIFTLHVRLESGGTSNQRSEQCEISVSTSEISVLGHDSPVKKVTVYRKPTYTICNYYINGGKQHMFIQPAMTQQRSHGQCQATQGIAQAAVVVSDTCERILNQQWMATECPNRNYHRRGASLS